MANVSIPDTILTEPARRHSQRLTARLHYSEPTDAEIDQMTDEQPLASCMRPHATKHIDSDGNASTLEGAEVPAQPVVIGLTDVVATLEDACRNGQHTARRNASRTTRQSGLVVLKTNLRKLSSLLSQLHAGQKSSDYPILRLEALVGELDEDDAAEDRVVFRSVRRNLERGKDVKGLIDFLTTLFASVKQRIAEEYSRHSEGMAEAAQKKKLFGMRIEIRKSSRLRTSQYQCRLRRLVTFEQSMGLTAL
jgi:hypothetical protein